MGALGEGGAHGALPGELDRVEPLPDEEQPGLPARCRTGETTGSAHTSAAPAVSSSTSPCVSQTLGKFQTLGFVLDARTWGAGLGSSSDLDSRPAAGGVAWEREHSSGWHPYSSAVSAKIEEAYASGKSKVRLRLLRPSGDELHEEQRFPIMEVYFDDMEQYDLWTQKVHAVRRTKPVGPLLGLRLAACGLLRLAQTGRWRREPRREYMARRAALARVVQPLLRGEEEDVQKFWQRHASETGKLHTSRSTFGKSFGTMALNTGVCARIVRTYWFFAVSMLVIFLNVIWIWIGIDMGSETENPLDADIHVHLIESAFCLYYVAEVIIRWLACARTLDALQDSWFLFDSVLASVMVLEVWLMPAWLLLGLSDPQDSKVADLAVLRLLKLMRLSRMARLLRAVPEVLWLLRGVTQSLRAVSFSVLLLVGMLFLFAVMFKTHFAGDDTKCVLEEEYFPTVLDSMLTLFLFGTLLDGPRTFWTAIAQESVLLGCVFLIFIFLSSLTLLNMLIGIICEVVQKVSREDRDRTEKVFLTQNLTSLLDDFDTNGDQHISRDEFDHLMQIPETHEVLEKFGTDPESMILLAEQIYNSDDDGLLNFKEFFEVVMRLQEGNRATVKDVIELKIFVSHRLDQLSRRLDLLFRGDAASTDARSRSALRAATEGSPAARLRTSTAPPEYSRVAREVSPDGGGLEAARPGNVGVAPQESPPLASQGQPAARQRADGARDEAFARRLEELAAGQRQTQESLRALQESQRALVEEVRCLRGALPGSGPAGRAASGRSLG